MTFVRQRQGIITRTFPHQANPRFIIPNKGLREQLLANGELLGAVAGAGGGTPPTGWTIAPFTHGTTTLTTVTNFPTSDNSYNRLELDAGGADAAARIGYEQLVNLAVGCYIFQIFLISKNVGSTDTALDILNGTGGRVIRTLHSFLDEAGRGWLYATFEVTITGTILLRFGLNLRSATGLATDGVTVERAYLTPGLFTAKFEGSKGDAV